MDEGSSLEDKRRRLQREVQLLEQSLSNADLHMLSSVSDESDSSESNEDQPGPELGSQSAAGVKLLEQRHLLHRQIQELERTLGPTSSFTDDLSDEDDEDGSSSSSSSSSSDEDELQLPQSVESCLQMNLVYQQVLQETLEQLETLLQQNTRQQRELLHQLSGPGSDRDQTKSKPSDQQSAKVYLASFLKPYFKDRLTGLGPPSNAEAKERNRQMMGLLDDRKLKIRRWEGWQKVLLIHAVSQDRRRKLIQPKLSKVDYLTQKLPSASDSAKAQLQEQIQGLEQEIQALREKKEEDLLGDRFEDVDWDRISKVDFEGSREPTDLQSFWQNFLHPSINKERWSDEEILKLKELCQKNQERDWTRVSVELGTGRTAFMCLQTYQRFVSDTLRKRRWTPAEDAQLRDLVENLRIGNFIPYTQMCYFMEDRLPSQLIYRWSKVLDPTLRKGPWSLEEDQLLIAAVKRHGVKNWWKIRREVPGRSDTACRDRYLGCLHPSLKKGPFSLTERRRLKELLQKHGVGRWSKIAAEMPNRTDSQCLREGRKLLKSLEQNGEHQEEEETEEAVDEETLKGAVVTEKEAVNETAPQTQETTEKTTEKERLSPVSLKRSTRKRRRPRWKDDVLASEDEAGLDVPYMDNSDEEKDPCEDVGAEEVSESKEKLDTASAGQADKQTLQSCSPDRTGAAQGVSNESRESTVSVSWVSSTDMNNWIHIEPSSKTFSFQPVTLSPLDGDDGDQRQRCTIVERAGNSVVEVSLPTALAWDQRHRSGVLMMIREEELLRQLNQKIHKLNRLGWKRQTETSCSYQLQAAMMPWIGHVVLRRDVCCDAKIQTGHQDRGIDAAVPTEPVSKRCGGDQELTTRLFRFFLRALGVDAESCRRMIEANGHRDDQNPEKKVRNVADTLGKCQIKQEPGNPEVQVHRHPVLPKFPKTFPPFLSQHHTMAQIQNVPLFSPTMSEGAPPGSQRRAVVLQPSSQATPRACFTVIGMVGTSQGQQLRLYTPQNKDGTPGRSIEGAVSTRVNPQLPTSRGTTADSSSQKQNVRPDHAPSFVRPVFLSPPIKPNIHVFSDSGAQKDQVFKVNPKMATDDLKKRTAILPSEGNAESSSSPHSEALLDHDYTVSSVPNAPSVLSSNQSAPLLPAPNHSAPSVLSSNQSAPSVLSSNQSAPSVLSSNQSAPSVLSSNQSAPSVLSSNQSAPSVLSSNQSAPLLPASNHSAPSVLSSNQSAPLLPAPNHGAPSVPTSNHLVPVNSGRDSNDEVGAEEALLDKRRRRKPTMKALALHQDQAKQSKRKLRQSNTKKNDTTPVTNCPVAPTSSFPTLVFSGLPSNPCSTPPAKLLPHVLVPPAPTYASFSILAASSPFHSPLVVSPQSLPSSNVFVSPPASFVPPPQTNHLLARPGSAVPTEFCDLLGGGQGEVFRWLSAEGGVSVGDTKLPYLPPFTSNLKKLNLLLQREVELKKEATKLLRKWTTRPIKTAQSGGKMQVKTGLCRTMNPEESRSECNTQTRAKSCSREPTNTTEATTPPSGMEEAGHVSFVNENAQSQAEVDPQAGQEKVRTVEAESSRELITERPGASREKVHQRPASGSDLPSSNRLAGEVAPRDAIRQIVRERFGSNPAFQLLLARFLSIFTLPALLASLQPITGEDEGLEGDNKRAADFRGADGQSGGDE